MTGLGSVPASRPFLFDGRLLVDLEIDIRIFEPCRDILVYAMALIEDELLMPCRNDPDINAQKRNDPEYFSHTGQRLNTGQ